jgi:hypothetical protein
MSIFVLERMCELIKVGIQTDKGLKEGVTTQLSFIDLNFGIQIFGPTKTFSILKFCMHIVDLAFDCWMCVFVTSGNYICV